MSEETTISITKKQADAFERLATVALFMKGMVHRLQIEHPDGEILLAVISKKKDGTGQVGPSWQPEEFFEDLETVGRIKLP